MQLAPWLWVESQVIPHPPQVAGVAIDVSHPLVSGGVPLQSSKPVTQPEYWHVAIPPVTTHAAPRLWVMSHAFPQAPHDDVDVSDVSQPLVLAPDWSQSARPLGHGSYWQV